MRSLIGCVHIWRGITIPVSLGNPEDAFRALHFAAQHRIMASADAAKRLTSEFRDDFQQIPWFAVSRMRDGLIHGYDTADREVIWDTVQRLEAVQ